MPLIVQTIFTTQKQQNATKCGFQHSPVRLFGKLFSKCCRFYSKELDLCKPFCYSK